MMDDGVEVELEEGFQVRFYEGFKALELVQVSIAVSLKRIADALEERNKRD